MESIHERGNISTILHSEQGAADQTGGSRLERMLQT